MDLKELERWLQTEEGKQWGEQYKAPLLSNRDSILSELKAASGKLSELGQRLSETENTLKSEKAVTSKYLIDSDLTALLKKANVFDDAIPRIIETLKTGNNLAIKADGDNRTVIGVLKDEKGNDNEAALQAVVDNWTNSPEAKYFRRNTNSGGGASGGAFYTAITPSTLRNIPGPELAKMSDSEFANLREQLQANRGEN
jgi:hypothetical protein